VKKSWKLLAICMLAMIFAMQCINVSDAAPKKKKDKIAPSRFARVAVLPVINLEEDIEYANTLVFQKALEVFRYPDYEFYDNDKLYKALEEVNYYEAGKEGVSEEMLRTIMQKSGAEMVVMVKLNKLQQEYYTYGREDMDQLTIDMEIMAVYSWRDKATKVHIKEKKLAEYATVMKTDWKMDEYASVVNKQLTRIAKLGTK